MNADWNTLVAAVAVAAAVAAAAAAVVAVAYEKRDPNNLMR